MTIQAGARIPEVTFSTMTGEGVHPLTTGEIFGGKRVVVFAVPGAFTPTCSDSHLPGYLERVGTFRARGVDTVACVAVNDVFVMDAWGKASGVGDAILMLADGNGELARAMGLEKDASRSGMGRRSRRWAALVEDGVIRVLHVEPAGGVTVSGAESLLASLPPREP